MQNLKDFFFEHRLVPSSVAWPAGLNYNGGITYDCTTAQFTEEANDYDFSRLGPKYVDGTGWNSVGFPSLSRGRIGLKMVGQLSITFGIPSPS